MALANLARLFQSTNRLREAELHYRQALGILEKRLRPEDSILATALHNLAQFLNSTGRPLEAEPLVRRALSIEDLNYGNNRPEFAIGLQTLASVLQTTNREAEAEPLFRRSMEIFLQFTVMMGRPHPHLSHSVASYDRLLSQMGRSDVPPQGNH